MSDLNRKAMLAELNAIIKRADSHIASKGPVSSAVAVARSEMAHTMKTDIENGVYDIPGAQAQGYFLETLRARWNALTPRQRRKLYDLDALLQISVRHLADPQKMKSLGDPAEPADEVLATPKPRRSPWFWPTIALSALITVIIGGTLATLFL